ncbi:MAG: phosphoribosylamine--glycine ligase [Candidatus Gracilibacteria bacterium]
MKKILLIGNGAREHVIAETLKKSRHEVELFVVGKTKNPGLVNLAKEYLLADVTDKDAIRDFALRMAPDFAILGPEAPIAAGIADLLLQLEIPSASPLQTVGRLESSKSFTRDLLEKYQIPGNPKFKVFTADIGLSEFFAELGEDFVVKADGLKGGKGVKVSGDHLNGQAEGLAYARECLAEGGRVVIEEKLIGQEFSLMSFCDGEHTCEMVPVQDHKRAYEGDKGPNTGGMGSYSCEDGLLPFLRQSDLDEAASITKKVAKALFDETGVYFKGIMYGGFIAGKNGAKLIEYNARFGDPEVMNVLPIMKTDFVDICEAMVNKNLDQIKVGFEAKATVCKYLVPNGYPDKPVAGEKIEVGNIPEGVRAYYASVDQKDDGLYLSGSRAIAFVGIANTLPEAEKLAESAVGAVKGPVFYRKDIGTTELINKRVEMMKELRK